MSNLGFRIRPVFWHFRLQGPGIEPMCVCVCVCYAEQFRDLPCYENNAELPTSPFQSSAAAAAASELTRCQTAALLSSKANWLLYICSWCVVKAHCLVLIGSFSNIFSHISKQHWLKYFWKLKRQMRQKCKWASDYPFNQVTYSSL